MMVDKLSKSIFFRGFRKMLISEFAEAEAGQIWQEANRHLRKLEEQHPNITGANKIVILPSAAL